MDSRGGVERGWRGRLGKGNGRQENMVWAPREARSEKNGDFKLDCEAEVD